LRLYPELDKLLDAWIAKQDERRHAQRRSDDYSQRRWEGQNNDDTDRPFDNWN